MGVLAILIGAFLIVAIVLVWENWSGIKNDIEKIYDYRKRNYSDDEFRTS